MNNQNHKMLIDMLSPFGDQEEMLADCAATNFGGKPFNRQVAGPGGLDVAKHDPSPDPSSIT